eukprot:EG_transcript_24665
MAVLITGLPGVGKTTLLLRTLELLQQAHPGLQLEGFVTEEVRGPRGRLGFNLRDLQRNTTVPLARLTEAGGPPLPQVGRYSVYVRDFEQLALPILRAAQRPGTTPEPRVVLVDEIGKMELNSRAFVTEMRALLTSGAVVVATVAEKGGGLIAEAKALPGVRLVTVTAANRDALPAEVVRLVSQNLPGGSSPPPPSPPPQGPGPTAGKCGKPMQ